MRISDILRDKGDRVVTVEPATTVQDLLSTLAEHRIGAVVVSTGAGSVDGIVSERDVVRALATRGAAVLAESVADIATTTVHTVRPEADVAEVERLMTERRVRHVPVLADGRLAGIVSIGDVVKRRITELEVEATALSGYITGERG
ncbi:CBS domain-containing protein [Actinoplanes sp. N902-109]|uniref:CBS domain-containing protein n=1 Tax=Actinoplanes sp. (strain N902-109) TaxID=649831 RepID=UPI0003294EEB|nr:CBS domain-containing protein [Actinoplanes sp. N902-109]AGL18236.1 hypothetical protein L083_4726 [Actinoplanes sp. N902-109]